MKSGNLILIGGIVVGVFLLSIMCFIDFGPKPSLVRPENTVKTLERAIRSQKWKTAASCFSPEFRRLHEKTIAKKEFYVIEANSGTLQTLMQPIPLIGKVKSLEVGMLDAHQAVVAITYEDFHDKESRPRNILLKKERKGAWLIVNLYHPSV